MAKRGRPAKWEKRPPKPKHGGKSYTAELHRRRAAVWARETKQGSKRAGFLLLSRRGGLKSSEGIKGIRRAAHMRACRMAKRAERERLKQLPQQLMAERLAVAAYAQFGAGAVGSGVVDENHCHPVIMDGVDVCARCGWSSKTQRRPGDKMPEPHSVVAPPQIRSR